MSMTKSEATCAAFVCAMMVWIAWPVVELLADMATVEDLGVLSKHRAILLEKCTNRTDFERFTLTLFPQRPPTNEVTVSTTNEFLTLDAIPTNIIGQVVMGVTQTCADGSQSEVSLFRLTVHRTPPGKPRAHSVALLNGLPQTNSVHAALTARRRQTFDTPLPPLPLQTNGEHWSSAMVREVKRGETQRKGQ